MGVIARRNIVSMKAVELSLFGILILGRSLLLPRDLLKKAISSEEISATYSVDVATAKPIRVL